MVCKSPTLELLDQTLPSLLNDFIAGGWSWEKRWGTRERGLRGGDQSDQWSRVNISSDHSHCPGQNDCIREAKIQMFIIVLFIYILQTSILLFWVHMVEDGLHTVLMFCWQCIRLMTSSTSHNTILPDNLTTPHVWCQSTHCKWSWGNTIICLDF